jgi:hypothetical protein
MIRRSLALLLFPLAASAGPVLVSQAPNSDWQSVGTIGTGTSTSAGTTVAVTTSAAAEAGNTVVCVAGKDESGSGTTDGTGNAQFTSIADSDGVNTWIEAYEWCNMQTSTAANGACVAVYYTDVTDTIESGDTITLTHTSVTSKAMSCWEFSAPGSTIAETAGENGLANDASDPGSMTLATGVAAEHLFIRASACESNNTGYTVDTDYTAFSNATANSGTSNTSMGVRGEFRIANESDSAASNPTYVSADCASAMIGLDES